MQDVAFTACKYLSLTNVCRTTISNMPALDVEANTINKKLGGRERHILGWHKAKECCAIQHFYILGVSHQFLQHFRPLTELN